MTQSRRPACVLIIEDDADIALSVKYYLEHEARFSVEIAADGELGLAQARRQRPDLILLDLNLPGLGGLEVCRRLKANGDTAGIGIIMLTARVEESDKIAGLELGADDYITKPFSMKELVARVRAVLRRSESADDAPRTLTSGLLVVDEDGRKVAVDEQEVTLTRKEFDLLVALLRRPGRVLSREMLLERVWGYDHPGETRTIDVHVRQLRRKLGEAAAIETVVGIGYRFRSRER